MSIRGKIKGKTVVLNRRTNLPDGTDVVVVVRRKPARKPNAKSRRSSLAQKLLALAGAAGPGLPRDFAENHDHYIHGTPKR